VGWCSEFGVEIASCDHPMVAGSDACHCEVCGTRCEGRFDGCPNVWARGPVQVDLVRRAKVATSNGSRPERSYEDSPSAEPEPARARSARHENGIDEVRKSLRRLEARVNTLEMSVRDEARLDRLDEAIARMLDALVAFELTARRPSGDAGAPHGQDPPPTTSGPTG
jgi:hypothetical protein